MERSPGSTLAALPRRPRVLLLIKGLALGGAEQLILNVAEHRHSEAFDYEVAYVLAALDSLVPGVAATGVPVHDLGARGDGDLRWMAALRRLLVARDFDLVHFHLPYTSALGRLVVLSLPSRRRPVLISTVHSIWGETPLVVRGLNRTTSGLDRRVIAVSQSVGDALPKALRRRATVVVHGMNLAGAAEVRVDRENLRREIRRELGVAEKELLVVTIANLRPEKGYEVLLEAAHLAVSAGSPLRFAAAGWGSQREALHALHHALGLGDGFLFLGQRSDVLRLLAAADIFVLASHYEGLPVALMEAMSMGLPIATTGVGEIPNILTDGVDALVVPPLDPPAMAKALGLLAGDEDLRRRLGDAALAKSEMFDITRSVARIESMYTDLIAGAL